MLLVLGVATVVRTQPAPQGDYYVLALSWLPGWCARTGDARDAAQCDRGMGWTVHGMWPQYHTGDWPAYCRTDARDPTRAQTAAMADIMGDGGLAWHQWKKHGRCTGLSASGYFARLRAAFDAVTIPPALHAGATGARLAPDTAMAALRRANPAIGADMAVLTCRDGQLHELRVCLTHGLAPRDCDSRLLARACDTDLIRQAPRR